jgi:hypothetical protein
VKQREGILPSAVGKPKAKKGDTKKAPSKKLKKASPRRSAKPTVRAKKR